MLKELYIKNFMSFKDEVIFSMEGDCDRVTEYDQHLINKANNKILRVTSIYGPNGGGKSNLINAILLPKKIISPENNYLSNYKKQYNCIYSDNENTEETIVFALDDVEIAYSFNAICKDLEINENDFNLMRNRVIGRYKFDLNILEESVFYKFKDEKEYTELFNRDKEGVIKSEYFSEIGITLPNLSKSNSVVRKIYDEYANNDFLEDKSLKIIRDLYREINSIQRLYYLFNFNNIKFIKNNIDCLVKLLNRVDIKISNIRCTDDEVYFIRKIKTKDGEIVEKEISLVQESDGTNKIFNIFCNVLECREKNTIFLCDDMNSFLHPKLSAAIVDLFNDQNNNDWQLIFNTHDITNMTNKVYRRDEIWFAYRDDNYSSILVPLSNIVNYKGNQVRKDAKYNKQYLEGKYGADPFIKKGLNWYE